MYDVALLIERRMEELDADQAVALHEGLDDTVRYHLLMPVQSSSALLASSLGAVGGSPVPVTEPGAVLEVQEELANAAEDDIAASAALLTARGQQVTTTLTEDDPVDALVKLVKDTGSSEAIILTESHLVQELLRIDWSSRAKRHLDVPTLHLLESVPFDAQTPPGQ
ncbi:hypothetical protein ASD11_05835 [Aeromicrobium sp. Root495]|uniref:hypothetical protein n=1 Tax=Aeromicrobium sp. Root495 TaxID=1736550 RepID=UPI0006FF5226|nr:hypothetical protein [Aeromicrobium sp. Root495]KQY59116.1 hypothetical protein ASD11_05835 [Aeromicrobium sp. Root495]RYJ07045.1 MAG: hypothetical protein EON52_03250 [Actinomycetales bacterium]